MIRFHFVEDHRDTYQVKRICTVLGIQRSSYYKWRAGKEKRGARAQADQMLAQRISAVHQHWDRTYGYRRITAELAEDPEINSPVNHKRVARLMPQRGIIGVHLRKRKITTVEDPGAQVFEDLLNRDVTAEAPGTAYVGDITYLPYGNEGKFLYLATVLDVCSKRLVGWSIADHMRTSLVADALHHAKAARGALTGALMHSDHGKQGGFNWSSQHLSDGGVRWASARGRNEQGSIAVRSSLLGVLQWPGARTACGFGRLSQPGPRRGKPVRLLVSPSL